MRGGVVLPSVTYVETVVGVECSLELWVSPNSGNPN